LTHFESGGGNNRTFGEVSWPAATA
jgi:hypothetical protein